MKIIMILNREDIELKKQYEYIVLKKYKTIVKNLELLNDDSFVDRELANGGKFLIEKWEKFNGERAHIVCGKHGGKLKPVHVVSNTDDQKALFQTEYNIVMRFNFDNNFLQIYENEVIGKKIEGNILQSLTFDDFFNGNVTTNYFDDIIRNVMSKVNSENFIYDVPFFAEGY